MGKLDWGHRPTAWIAGVMLLVGLVATAARTVAQHRQIGEIVPTRQGMCDFHNGIYFPTQAMLSGVSPYGDDYAEAYPVSRQIPFFSPAILGLHAPFALMPLGVAEVLFFLFSVALVIIVSGLIVSAAGMPGRLDALLVAAAAIVFSRAGHISLFNGYFTLELVLATFLAVHWGRRYPWLSGLALVVVSAKPTYILPLGLLLLARGDVRPLVIGAVFSVIAALLPFGWMAYHEGDGDWVAGAQIIRADIQQTQEFHRAQPDEAPVHSWTRIDLLAVVAKWTQRDPAETTHLVVMAVLLAPPMLLLHHRRRQGCDDGLAGITGAIVLSAALVSVYHQSYDALLMAAPLAGAVVARVGGWKGLPRLILLTMAVLMAIPAFNYLSTRLVLSRLDPGPQWVQVLTSVNGICLALALIGLCWIGARSSRTPT